MEMNKTKKKYREFEKEKFAKCKVFFDNLSTILYDRYDVIGSCNADKTLYLVPCGTEHQISYGGKPRWSFRLSDHWNWYANTEKCQNEKYVQCWSVDVPFARPRVAPGKPSLPRKAIQVSLVGKDGKYHCVNGEFFDRKTKTWGWIENSPVKVAEMVALVI